MNKLPYRLEMRLALLESSICLEREMVGYITSWGYQNLSTISNKN